MKINFKINFIKKNNQILIKQRRIFRKFKKLKANFFKRK